MFFKKKRKEKNFFLLLYLHGFLEFRNAFIACPPKAEVGNAKVKYKHVFHTSTHSAVVDLLH